MSEMELPEDLRGIYPLEDEVDQVLSQLSERKLNHLFTNSTPLPRQLVVAPTPVISCAPQLLQPQSHSISATEASPSP